MEYKLIFARPYRTGGELYRIIISCKDSSQNIEKSYEVWVTQEALEEHLVNFYGGAPKPSDLFEYGKWIYEDRWKQLGSAPAEDGAFVTKKNIEYGNPKDFAVRIDAEEIMVHTNISLPQSMHRWLLFESAKTKKSLSEIIRETLLRYKNRTFQCTSCGEVLQGDPFFETKKGDKLCYACFLKPFENE